MKKGLTISMVFEATSANYGESFGNIASLKKLTRSGGNSYTYISRQALRYNIIQQMEVDNTPVEAIGSGAKKVIQFKLDTSVKYYPEIDLFGYMKTEKGKGAETRSAVVRLSNAVSLEAFSSDLDFQTNMGLANRSGEQNSIAQSEQHKSFYAYTIVVDLERVGVDGQIEINTDEKAKRVKSLLKTIQFLYRDIRGRRENLSPVFMVGGVYERKNPYFDNRLRLSKLCIDVNVIKDIVDSDNDVLQNTVVGYLDGTFCNNQEIKEKLNPFSVSKAFSEIEKRIEAVYK